MTDTQETPTPPWEGMTAEEAFKLGSELREAQPTVEETSGGYEPRKFQIAGSRGTVFFEQPSIDASANAIALREQEAVGDDAPPFLPIVDWDTAKAIVSELEAEGHLGTTTAYVHWLNDEQVVIHTITGNNVSDWAFWERTDSGYLSGSLLLMGVDFEVVN